MLQVSCAFSVYVSVWFILQVSHLVLVHTHVSVYITGERLSFSVYACISVYTAGEQLGFSVYACVSVYATGEQLCICLYSR